MNKLPYDIVSFSKNSFFALLSNGKSPLSDTERNNRAIYLFKYLESFKIKTIVAEHEYIDGDYLEDYSSYYVRCYSKYEGHCKRLHFFCETFDDTNFTRLITRDFSKDAFESKITASYRGFIVARPLPKAIIGRTLLPTYPFDTNTRFISLRVYKINLFGLNLEVQSLPFQEQDKVLAACATVALWSAFHQTAHLFGTSTSRPAEITKVACEAGADSRLFPSTGLKVSQMAHAIRSVGLEPELVRVNPQTPLVSVIYSYLKFGLPVVIGYTHQSNPKELHAVTLTGYSISDKGQVIDREVDLDAKNQCPPLRGLRIGKFYAHDDQIGPFSSLLVKVSGDNDHPIYFVTENGDEVLPKWLFVPLYNKIRIGFTCIQIWIERFWEWLLKDLLKEDSEDIDKDVAYEWDAYLAASNNLKNELSETLGGHKKQKSFLITQHPRFAWRISLENGGKRILDLFGDATDVEHSMPFYELIWLDSEVELLVAKRLNEHITPEVENILTPRFLEFLRLNTSSSAVGSI